MREAPNTTATTNRRRRGKNLRNDEKSQNQVEVDRETKTLRGYGGGGEPPESPPSSPDPSTVSSLSSSDEDSTTTKSDESKSKKKKGKKNKKKKKPNSKSKDFTGTFDRAPLPPKAMKDKSPNTTACNVLAGKIYKAE